jgi:hypothetical protein
VFWSLFRRNKVIRISPDQEALVRAVVRDELEHALHENGNLRYLFLQGARAEAWAVFARLMDTPEEEWGTTKLCHFCPFSSTPAEVARHESDHHRMPGPRSWPS